MKQSIIIKGKPFYFDALSITEDSAEKITFDEAKSLLFASKKILDDLNIKFSLAFGTLLGAIREHSFISHDYDIDIMVFDREEFLSAIPAMAERGLKLCRVVPDRLYSFTIDRFYIDIYIVADAPSILGRWCYMIGSDTIWKKYLQDFDYIDFLGQKFLAPKDPENIVAFWYGNNWRTPIKGYHGRCDIYPVYFYRKYIKPLLKKIK